MLKNEKKVKFHSIRLDEIEHYLFTPVPKEEKKEKKQKKKKQKSKKK
jgi:hypothetical protein